MNALKNIPGFRLVSTYPRLSAWVVLSVGMVALLIIEARDVGLLAGQWVALIVASVVVAGICVWIISWEDDNDGEGNTPEDVTNPKMPKVE